MTAKAIRMLRDRKAGNPEAANNRVKAIRRVFAWALEWITSLQTRRATSPMFATRRMGTTRGRQLRLRNSSSGIRSGTKPRLALAILLFTGLRRSDVVLLGRQHARQGWFKLTLQKNRRRKPITIELPVLPALQSALDEGPTGDLTFLVTEQRQAVHGRRVRQLVSRPLQRGWSAAMLEPTD